jgi:DNA polymerase-3 subunit alpha
LLGLYLSFHPLDKYREYFQEHVEIISGIDLEEVDGGKGIVGGIVIASREIITKKGDKMAFVKLEDTSSEIELVVFPQSYAKHQGVLQKSNAVIAVSGKFDAKDRDGNLSDDLKMIVDEISEVTEDHLKTNQKPKFDPPKPSTYGNSRPRSTASKPFQHSKSSKPTESSRRSFQTKAPQQNSKRFKSSLY